MAKIVQWQAANLGTRDCLSYSDSVRDDVEEGLWVMDQRRAKGLGSVVDREFGSKWQVSC